GHGTDAHARTTHRLPHVRHHDGGPRLGRPRGPALPRPPRDRAPRGAPAGQRRVPTDEASALHPFVTAAAGGSTIVVEPTKPLASKVQENCSVPRLRAGSEGETTSKSHFPWILHWPTTSALHAPLAPPSSTAYPAPSALTVTVVGS